MLLICFQGIFTVDSQGVRKVVGMYDYGNWDANACGKDDEYIGMIWKVKKKTENDVKSR